LIPKKKSIGWTGSVFEPRQTGKGGNGPTVGPRHVEISPKIKVTDQMKSCENSYS
jgi:hypothetical protein